MGCHELESKLSLVATFPAGYMLTEYRWTAIFSVAIFSPGYMLTEYSSVATFSYFKIQGENVATQKLYHYQKTPLKLWPPKNFPAIFGHFSIFFKCGFIVCSYVCKHAKQASISFTKISGGFEFSKTKLYPKISLDGNLMATFCRINTNHVYHIK